MSTSALCGAGVLAALMVLMTSASQAASAREEFEKYGLLGAYAMDCSNPVSETNGYVYYRAVDATRVQRDTMERPDKSTYVSVAETAAATRASEITVTGVTVDSKPLSYILRIDGQRQRVWRWTEDGVTSVVDGVWVEHKYVMPWLTKCQ